MIYDFVLLRIAAIHCTEVDYGDRATFILFALNVPLEIFIAVNRVAITESFMVLWFLIRQEES